MKQLFTKLIVAGFILMITNCAKAQDVVSTIAGMGQSAGYYGDGGPATDAQLYSPSDITFDKSGNLYIADFVNQVVRKVDTFGKITTVAGNGYGHGSAGAGGYSGDGGPATAARLNGPYGIAIDAAGNIIFADGYNHIVRKVTPAGIITTIAGKSTTASYLGDGGPATDATLNNPVGIAIDKTGNIYIADDHNNAIRKVDAAGNISTFAGGNLVAGYAGDGGPATMASLSLPIGIAFDTAGNLFIADVDNNVIRKVSTSGIISTVAGTGAKGYTGDGGAATSAKLDTPQRVNFDKLNNLYISDGRNNVIRKVNSLGVISTFAGSGQGADGSLCYYGGDDSAALVADFCLPQGVAFDLRGRTYICDRGNSVIRRIGPATVIDHSGVNGLDRQAAGSLTVYPNPASDKITINVASGIDEQVELVIANVLGKIVKKLILQTNRPACIILDVPKGIYFMSAATPREVLSKKIIIN